MATKEVFGGHRIDETVAAGQTALEQSHFEEAVTHLRAALRLGPRSSDEEAQIRCLLSIALDRKGLYPEQLEAVPERQGGRRGQAKRARDRG